MLLQRVHVKDFPSYDASSQVGQKGSEACIYDALTTGDLGMAAVTWVPTRGVPERLPTGSFMFYITITFGDCVLRVHKGGTAMKSYRMRIDN
jgi:hypothetical protein